MALDKDKQFKQQRIKQSYGSLTGGEKAAIFMLSLDNEHASTLFNLMEDDEIKTLTLTMSKLGAVDAEIVSHLLAEFAAQKSTSGPLVGNADATERLLLAGFDSDRVDSIMEEIRGPAGRTMWDKLGNVDENVLSNYLKNEHPQTVALVLSKLKPEHCSRVLSILPENFAMEVMMRLLQMEAVQKDVLDGVETTLRSEFMGNAAASSRRPDGHEKLASIFNNFDGTTEERLMAALEKRNETSAEKIKGLMFTFDDLVNVDPTGIQVLLRQVDKDQLALAMKGSTEELQGLFFKNMSERAGKMMSEDMDAMGPVRLKDVNEAQATIVATARKLGEEGEIVIGGGGDELIF
jgi:flagellar motor switch protein FliG